MIANEAPDHLDDEPLNLDRICECKVSKKIAHAYKPVDWLLSPRLKHVAAKVRMHWLGKYLHAIARTRLLLKFPCLTYLHYKSINMLYGLRQLRTY